MGDEFDGIRLILAEVEDVIVHLAYEEDVTRREELARAGINGIYGIRKELEKVRRVSNKEDMK